MTYRRVGLWWFALVVTIGAICGWITASRHRPSPYPPPPYFGTTVSPGAEDEALTVRIGGALLPVRGRWFESGNSRWRVYPIKPIAAALRGEYQQTDDGLRINACGREVVVRWADRGRRPRVDLREGQKSAALKPRWPMRAGELITTPYHGYLGEMDGIWLYKGEALASDGWLLLVLGLKAEPYGPEFSVKRC